MSNRCLVVLEPAYVLHHYPYRDSSLLLEVFTRIMAGWVWSRAAPVRRGRRWHDQLQGCVPCCCHGACVASSAH